MSTDTSFVNKNIVVIGGTSGINRGIAEFFARSGACLDGIIDSAGLEVRDIPASRKMPAIFRFPAR